MKKFTPVLAAALLSLLSCNRQEKDAFVLQGSIEEGGNDSILVIGLDSRFDRSDFIHCTDGQFSWSFVPDTVTPLLLIMPDGQQFPVFAEKAVTATFTMPSDGSTAVISGGHYNDIIQVFREQALSDTSALQTIARIDSIILDDPFSECAPYLVCEYMVRKWHCSQNTIRNTTSKMSGITQDSPLLVSLRSRFIENEPANVYLSDVSLTDSTGQKLKLQDMGSQGHMVVCVWASWHEGSVQARRDLTRLADAFEDYNLTIADISIDVRKDRWINCLREDSLQWQSFNENGGWSSRIVTNTYIQEFPSYIVFSSMKKVMYRSSSIDGVMAYIEKNVPKKAGSKTTGKKDNLKDSTVPKKFKLNTL